MQIGFQERDNINKRETKEKKIKVSIHNSRARFIGRICAGLREVRL